MKPIKKLIAVNGNRVVVNYVTEKQFDELLESLASALSFSFFQMDYLKYVKHIPFVHREYRTEPIFKELNVHCDYLSILRHDVSAEIKEALVETLALIMPHRRLIVPVRLARYYFASVS